MGVYEDMANDAGYPFGTPENEQMAQLLYAHEEAYHEEQFYEQWLYDNIYPWLAWWRDLGRYNEKI